MFEISQAQLIETGLNVAGYLAASALSILLYASVFNRKLRRIGFPIIGSPTAERVAPEPTTERAERSAQGLTVFEAPAAEAPVSATRDQRYNRNRSEVIRLAREMMAAGNSAERVTDLLPVTESEMQLIQLSSGDTAER